jgi:beta-lactamase class A
VPVRRCFAALFVLMLLIPGPTHSTAAATNIAIWELRVLSPGAAKVARDRHGLVGAAVLPLDGTNLYSFQGTRAFPMYSTAKIPIMLAVLDRAVREDRRVSERERNLIKAMIQVSDNKAASTLLADVGGAAAVNHYLATIGLTKTTIVSPSWGASTTTAQEMARMMAQLGNCTILVERLCVYALETMRGVVRSQRWGVTAGVAEPGAVALKNGWYPQRNGWGINSVGLVVSGGRRYAIAIYTNPDPSMAYGIETIEQISREVYPAVR